MDWAALGGQIIGLGAPLIGGALGGPAGAIAGKILADVLGVDATPEAVNTALANDPSTHAKLAEADAEWAKVAQEVAKAGAQQTTAVNESMRAEIASGTSWTHWRNLQAYELFLFECPLFFLASLFVVGGDLRANDYRGVSTFMALATGFILPYFFARCGLLGWTNSQTTTLRTTAMTGEHQPSVIGTIGEVVKAFAKR